MAFLAVDSHSGAITVDSFAEREYIASEENSVQEPCIGMEFDSEDAAKEFYDEYARRLGFIMRIDQCRRSEVDKRILSRRLSCNKQGYNAKLRHQYGPVKKPRGSSREGCKAMMLVKVDKAGKWVVSRFVKEHTHPLVVSGRPSRSQMVSCHFCRGQTTKSRIFYLPTVISMKCIINTVYFQCVLLRLYKCALVIITEAREACLISQVKMFKL